MWLSSWRTEVLPLPQVCARWIASIPFASAAVGKWGPSAVPCVELHHGCTMAMSRTAERAAKGCTNFWCGVQQKYADVFYVFVCLVEAFLVFWGVLFVILGFPFSLFWIVLGWVNGGTCFGSNTCECFALVNSISHRNSVYHHPTLGAWRLRGWMCQRDCHCPTKCYLAGIVCCILAFAAIFQKATEGNTTKYVVRKIQRTENSGKGRENGGKGRTLKIEFLPETCPKGFTTDFAFFLAVIPLVKLCWKLQSKSLNVDGSQCSKLYCSGCFQHCFSCSVSIIRKSLAVCVAVCQGFGP